MKNLLKEWGLSAASSLLSLAALILVLVGGNQSVPGKLAGLTNLDELAAGQGAIKFKQLSLGSGSNLAVYTNSGPTSEFLRGLAATDGTASSSFKVFLIASTSATVPASQDFSTLSPRANGRLLVMTLATSTAATTTEAIMATASAKSDGTIVLKKGESALLYLQRGDANCQPDATLSGGCEQATSTNRGFNVSALLSIVSTSTSYR